jgi:4-hydroxy-tetrahydrodipicolinate reductase
VKIILIGYGKMGHMIEETAKANGDEVVAAFDENNLTELAKQGRVDVVMDFSRPAALSGICSYIRRTGSALVSGTTGYSDAQMKELLALGRLRAGAVERQLLHRPSRCLPGHWRRSPIR